MPLNNDRIYQDDVEYLLEQVKKAKTANKHTEVNSAVRRIEERVERVIRRSDLDHPDRVCPECGDAIEEDVFCCSACYEENPEQMRKKHA